MCLGAVRANDATQAQLAGHGFGGRQHDVGAAQLGQLGEQVLELGAAGRDLNFNAYADNRALFRYVMHTLPSEISDSIGTSTLFAAWNAAIYVAQVEDDRLAEVVADGRYLDATRSVLRERGGLWFFDESYVISRRRA